MLLCALIAGAGVAMFAPLMAAVSDPAVETATPRGPARSSPPRVAGPLVPGLPSRVAEGRPGDAEAAGIAASERVDSAAAPALGPEEELRQGEIFWQERLAHFEAQPVDRVRGAEVEGRLHLVLTPVAQRMSGRVTDVECRSTACKVTIDWAEGKAPSMEDGTSLMLESVPATRGCARHFRLADPHNHDATTLLIECA